MAKFQNFQNSNRYDQNVGKVLISRKMVLKNSKHPFWAKISLTSFFLNFGTQGGPPIGPLFGRRAFFLQTPVVSMAKEALMDVMALVEADKKTPVDENRGPIGGPTWVQKFKNSEINKIWAANGCLEFFRSTTPSN